MVRTQEPGFRLPLSVALTMTLAGMSAVPAYGDGSVARQVAAPPSDILDGVVRLPDPGAAATRSRALIVPLAFERTPRSGGRWSAEVELPVDAAGPLVLALLSPDAGLWSVALDDGRGAARPLLDLPGLARTVAPAGDELPGWAVARFDVAAATPGTWRFRIDATGERAPEPGWFLARTAAPLVLEAWVASHQLTTDAPIPIVARLAGASRGVAVERARAVVERSGVTSVLELADDGEHADGARGDGRFGAWIPEGGAGPVRARVELAGRHGNGARFARSAELAFPVLDRWLHFTGDVEVAPRDGQRLALELHAAPRVAPRRVHVSAEVWGTDAAGERVPVCWLSRQVEPRAEAGTWRLALELDRDWIDLAGATAPWELREVRAQDPGTEVVVDHLARLPARFPTLPARPPGMGPAPSTPTSAMLRGGTASVLAPPPQGGPGQLPAEAAPVQPALMLVHGYCSSGSIWPAADFTAPKLEFLDPNQNRTHDAFAQLLDQRAVQVALSSFGVVAHSQGGCAALHLLTYYSSGLDMATGPRRIQSLATPYQGTPLASLGAFACGVNNNMTPAGAATWLAGIPSWARAEVSYWTTANSGANCNALAALFLTDPEDGTVEQFRGQLPGAQNMGQVTGWCHTTGMTNPASYTDHARNQAMNAAAAR